jgi:hypothetical protein
VEGKGMVQIKGRKLAGYKGETKGAHKVRVRRGETSHVLASWPNGETCKGLCLGVCVEGHQGLSLSPQSEDRSVAMPTVRPTACLIS